MSEYCDEKLEKGISINVVGLLDDTEVFYLSSSELRLLVGWLAGLVGSRQSKHISCELPLSRERSGSKWELTAKPSLCLSIY